MNQMKPKLLGVLIAALAIGAFAIAPTVGSAEEAELLSEGCEANHVCGYTKVEFTGQRFQIPCSSSGNFLLGSDIRSARNRCGNKINHLVNGGTSICMNPGGDRPNPGTFPVITLPNSYGGSC